MRGRWSLFAVGLVLAASLAPSPAVAQDGDVLREFGMLGRFARDCSKAASESNPHLTFSVGPEGGITRTLRMSGETTIAVRNVRLLAPDRLEFNQSGRDAELTTTIAKIDGRFQSWHAVRSNGTVLIADGKIRGTGQPSVTFEPCRD